MNRYRIPLGTLLLFALTLIFPLLTGCGKKQADEPIALPATSVLSVQTKWGVITSTHLRLRDEPSIESGNPLTTFWRSRGFVLEILSRSDEKMEVEGKEDYWYRIQYDGLYGWVFGGYVEVYETREAAEEAAGRLKG